jgi:hypothetical protein
MSRHIVVFKDELYVDACKLFYLLCVCMGLDVKLRASYMLSKCCTAELHPQSLFYFIFDFIVCCLVPSMSFSAKRKMGTTMLVFRINNICINSENILS